MSNKKINNILNSYYIFYLDCKTINNKIQTIHLFLENVNNKKYIIT